MPGIKSSNPKGVTKDVFQQQQAEKLPEAYGTGYGGKLDLHPSRYPNAISHDTAFHDAMYEHISNLRARIDGALGSGKVQRVASIVSSHLDKAENELNRSFAAHKAGSEDGVTAFHTANEAYLKAHQHLSNAHRALTNGLGITSSAMRRVGGENATLPLLTSEQRTGLVSSYSKHVRDAANKRKMALPEGVAPEKRDVNLSDIGEISQVGTSTYTQRTSTAGSSTKLPRDRARLAAYRLREDANITGRTHTLAEAQRVSAAAAEGVKLQKPRKSAYAGVGITGFNTVARAAKIHFEYNNPGKSWFNSPESKDPVGYAAKHKVGLPDQAATISKFTRLMGLNSFNDDEGNRKTVGETTAGRIAANTYSEDPLPKQTAKPSRNGEFKAGGNK